MCILPFSIQQIVTFALMSDEAVKIEIANRVVALDQIDKNASLDGFTKANRIEDEIAALAKILEAKKVELAGQVINSELS